MSNGDLLVKFYGSNPQPQHISPQEIFYNLILQTSLFDGNGFFMGNMNKICFEVLDMEKNRAYGSG